MSSQNLALGTVGWDQDTNYYDLGTPGTDKCLVKVTLIWGRNPVTPLTGGGAQGAKIVATLPGPIFHLPDLGDLVTLAIPTDMERVPGAATIRDWHKATPEGFDANNAMWPIEDGKTATIGDSQADFVALAQKVLTELQSIAAKFNSHTHVYIPGTAAPVPTAPPIAQMSPNSVAATKFKAT